VATDLALRQPDDTQLEQLARAADLTDLATLDVDTLADQARWHKDQADHHQQRALYHWLECGRRLLAIKSQMDHGAFMPLVADELSLPQSTANEMMYLARNSQRVGNLLTERPEISTRAAISEVRRQVQIEKHAQPPRAIPWVAQLPANIEIEEGDAAALPLPDECIDLIVTSPPYNLDKAYGSGIDDDQDYADYLEYVASWAREMYRVAGPHGRLALNVPLDTMLGGTPRPVYADWYYALKEAGWQYRSTIIWHEGNVTRSNARGSIASPSSPYVAAPVEMVLLAHKGAWGLVRDGAASDLTREESVAWQGPAAGLWAFGGETRSEHPAAFPPELPRRLIKLLSYPGDVVLDPFMGSGTTAVVARALGRTVYGYDRSPRWVALARERVAQERQAA
jgi:site-specific DNA-methyltransferase (adenine-specific)